MNNVQYRELNSDFALFYNHNSGQNIKPLALFNLYVCYKNSERYGIKQPQRKYSYILKTLTHMFESIKQI